MARQEYIRWINAFTQWSLFALIICGGGAIVFILGLLLAFLISKRWF